MENTVIQSSVVSSLQISQWIPLVYYCSGPASSYMEIK